MNTNMFTTTRDQHYQRLVQAYYDGDYEKAISEFNRQHDDLLADRMGEPNLAVAALAEDLGWLHLAKSRHCLAANQGFKVKGEEINGWYQDLIDHYEAASERLNEALDLYGFLGNLNERLLTVIDELFTGIGNADMAKGQMSRNIVKAA
jgi:hypothetical protein